MSIILQFAVKQNAKNICCDPALTRGEISKKTKMVLFASVICCCVPTTPVSQMVLNRWDLSWYSARYNVFY